MPEEGWIAVAVAGAVLVALPLNLVIHELGHLLVALLTGLRVTGVRISLRGHSAVMVRPAGPALPVRMAAMTLGGAAANIGCAVLAWQLSQQALPVPVRVGLACAAIIGVIFGVANLLPVRLRVTAPDLDGLTLARWIFRPRLTTAATTTDVAHLDRIIERTRHPLVLLAAVIRRRAIDPGYPRFVAMAERLNAIAHDARTKPAHAAAIAADLALTFGIGYLHMGIVEGNAIDRANADELIEIAELGHRLRPKNEYTRLGLAVARLLEHRPAPARDLLAGFRGSRLATYVTATQLFAIAEIYLGRRERATAILARLSHGDPALSQIISTLTSTDALPALVRDRGAHAGDGSPSADSVSSAVSVDSVGADAPMAASSPEASTPLRP